MADFMRVKYENPKLKQSEIANQLGMSSSTIQRYKNDINMLSPYRINPNNTEKRSKKVKITDFDNNSHDEADVKRLQMKILRKQEQKTIWKVGLYKKILKLMNTI